MNVNDGPKRSRAGRMPTKDHTSHRPEHQYQGDAPSNLRVRFAELLGQLFNGEGDCEEVECIP